MALPDQASMTEEQRERWREVLDTLAGLLPVTAVGALATRRTGMIRTVTT